MFIKYEAEVSSRVGGGERGVVDFGKLFTETNVSCVLPYSKKNTASAISSKVNLVHGKPEACIDSEAEGQ